MSVDNEGRKRPRKRDWFLGLFKGRSARSSSNTAQRGVVQLHPGTSQVERGVDVENRGITQLRSHDGRNSRPVRLTSPDSNTPPDETSTGMGTTQSLAVLEKSTYIQNQGQIFTTTNTGDGPVHNVGHIENASFHMSDGGPEAMLWNSLPKQRDTSAQHNEYLEGSREGDVRAILDWIDRAPPGELVRWIQGPAAVGKSTLARHLTHLLRTGSKLAASVFLSALPSDARGPESVIKLIARDIGTIHPTTIPLIVSAISACYGAPSREQLEKLILGPIQSLRRSCSLVIVLDAIDEWEYYELLVKELAWIASSSPTLKFILLGRSDSRTRGFEGAWLSTYELKPVSNATMERYFAKEFESIKWGVGRRPSHDCITRLVELANGLFLWATVVCSLLKKRLSRSSPNETLDAIVYARKSIGTEVDLATLYHQAIFWLFPKPDDRGLLRQYLGATLVLQEPLPVDAFSSLVKLPAHTVVSIKSELTALQIRHPIGHAELIYPIGALFHLSFPEYLESSSMPPDIAFHVSAFESHSQLAVSCLLELRDFLPRVHHSSPSDLSTRQKYAIKYMPAHVHQGTPCVEPGSDMEWKQTPHFSLLREIPIASFNLWGHLLASLVLTSYSVESEDSDSDQETVMDDTEDCDESSVEDISVEDTETFRKSRGELMGDVAARLKGEPTILPLQISCLEVAVRLESSNPHCWNALGWAYNNLVKTTRSGGACDKAVRAHRHALEAGALPNNTDEGELLFSLGTALGVRYDYFRDRHDLSESITLHRSALSLRPRGHSSRTSSLNNLANSLSKAGSIGDLQESISLRREALELRPIGHPLRALCLKNLAGTLSDTGSIGDLRESITLLREVLGLRPPGHPDHATSLDSLAYSLSKTGSIGDMEESIRLHREVLVLCPPGHPDHGQSLNLLANDLLIMHEAQGLVHPPG